MNSFHSTSDISADERFDYWQDVTSQVYVSVGCEAVEGKSAEFAARVEHLDLGNMWISRHQISSPMRYVRTKQHFERDNCADFQFTLIEKGQAFVHQGGRVATIKSGDMVLYGASEPFVLEFTEPHATVTFQMPQSCIRDKVKAPNLLTAKTLAGTQGLGPLAAATMLNAFTVREVNTVSARFRVASAMLELVSTAVDLELQDEEAVLTKHQALLESIKSFMLSNLEDSDLSIDSISRRHNITPRTLNRLFAQSGTTAIRWLWHQRLLASHKMLSEGRVGQVAEVALLHGFSDFSHFSRSFKKMFGMSPNTLLIRR
jgi:AraC-like DNA-binding protein